MTIKSRNRRGQAPPHRTGAGMPQPRNCISHIGTVCTITSYPCEHVVRGVHDNMFFRGHLDQSGNLHTHVLGLREEIATRQVLRVYVYDLFSFVGMVTPFSFVGRLLIHIFGICSYCCCFLFYAHHGRTVQGRSYQRSYGLLTDEQPTTQQLTKIHAI